MNGTQTEIRGKQAALDKLAAAIDHALDEAPVADVLLILKASFLGLSVDLARRQGRDVSKEFMVDGGHNRDITIHAPKVPPVFRPPNAPGSEHSSTR